MLYKIVQNANNYGLIIMNLINQKYIFMKMSKCTYDWGNIFCTPYKNDVVWGNLKLVLNVIKNYIELNINVHFVGTSEANFVVSPMLISFTL